MAMLWWAHVITWPALHTCTRFLINDKCARNAINGQELPGQMERFLWVMPELTTLNWKLMKTTAVINLPTQFADNISILCILFPRRNQSYAINAISLCSIEPALDAHVIECAADVISWWLGRAISIWTRNNAVQNAESDITHSQCTLLLFIS